MAGSDLAHPVGVAGLAVVIMGVSGCGKSTVAAMLAQALGCSFIEADDYHSQANKAKMSKGIPLTDADRIPWLESLRGVIRERLDRGEDVAVSCSALRHKYREILQEGDCSYKAGNYATCRVKFICLEASAEVIAERVRREGKGRGALHAGKPAADRLGGGDHRGQCNNAPRHHRPWHHCSVQG